MSTIPAATITQPGFAVDPHTLVRGNGAPINWSRVPDSYKGSDGVKALKPGTAVARTPAGFIPQDAPRTAAVTNLTADATTATATATAHPYSTGDVVYVKSASGRFDGYHTVTKTGANSFTFPISGSPAADAGASTSKIALEGVILSGAIEGEKSAALSGYGVAVGGVVYENLIPGMTAALREELRSTGTGFGYQVYQDTRA